MAHGSKKWIVRYDGKIKRSNDRTKKDYYGDLKWWSAPEMLGRWKHSKNPPCPQCKHVAKAAKAIETENRARHDAFRAQYMVEHGAALDAWNEYHRAYWRVRREETLEIVIPPKMKEPPHFWDWAEQHKHVRPVVWLFDDRSYLCYKCERKYEVDRASWYVPLPGKKKRYTWSVRQNYREYRNEVRNVMARAKYDEEYYDDILPYKHNWLD